MTTFWAVVTGAVLAVFGAAVNNHFVMAKERRQRLLDYVGFLEVVSTEIKLRTEVEGEDGLAKACSDHRYELMKRSARIRADIPVLNRDRFDKARINLFKGTLGPNSCLQPDYSGLSRDEIIAQIADSIGQSVLHWIEQLKSCAQPEASPVKRFLKWVDGDFH